MTEAKLERINGVWHWVIRHGPFKRSLGFGPYLSKVQASKKDLKKAGIRK